MNNNNNNSNNSNNNISLIIALIGLPACGKTYFSNYLVNKNEQFINDINSNSGDYTINIYHIEYDKIYNSVNELLNSHNKDKDIPKLETYWKLTRLEIFNQVYNITKNSNDKIILLNRLQPTISYNGNNNNKNINLFILDDNMYYKSMRHKFYQLSTTLNEAQNDIRYCQVYFIKDKKKSIENNSKRINKNGVTDEIIEKMNDLIENPNIDKNQWERENTIFLESNNDYNTIFNDIKTKFSKFKENNQNYHNNEEQQYGIDQKKENDKNITKNNIIHQFDNHCRKIIGELIKSNIGNGHPYSNQSKLFTQYKQQFLKTTLTQFIQENNDFIHQYSDIIPYKEQLLNNFKNTCLDNIL